VKGGFECGSLEIGLVRGEDENPGFKDERIASRRGDMFFRKRDRGTLMEG